MHTEDERMDALPERHGAVPVASAEGSVEAVRMLKS